MPTYNQLQAQAVRDTWQGKRIVCYYNDKQRIGVIRFVKQGPAIEQNNGEYFFMNEPNGKVYIDFQYDGGKMRCFIWAKVVDPRAAPDEWYDQPKKRRIKELDLPAMLVVKRPRTIE